MLPHLSRGFISLRFDQMQDRDDVREGDRYVFWGDYSKWSYGYHWLIFYLDLRYRSIVGHVGLMRFLPQFEQFRDAIQRFCQKDRWYHDQQGNTTFIPGLDAFSV